MSTSPIRHALETIRELEEGRFMDKLALAIHEATNAVTTFNKPGTITIKIKVAPLSKANVTEPVITMKAKIDTDLPEPAGTDAIFFVDADGNPTTQQQRQRGLDLQIAGRDSESSQAQGAAQ